MTPLELLRQLNELDERPRIEAKTGSEMGKSVLETVCAFSNEPGMGGGWLLLGAAPDEQAFWPQYEVLATLPGSSTQATAGEAIGKPIQPAIKPIQVPGEAIQVSPSPVQVSDLPPALARQLERLGKKPKPTEFRAAVIALCEWQALSASDLARLLNRSRVYLLNNYLTQMVADGLIVPTIPSQPKHPQQAYRATKKGGEA